MNRRKFLINTSSLIALSSLPSIPLWAEDSTTKITILHTNDQHSSIEPFDRLNSKYPNQGGFARRAGLIDKIRSEEKNVLLLDSGDIFQGTPYFNFYGGELEFKLMSKMGYDVATLGNHDFDNGLEGLKKQLPNATFEFVIANYDFSKTIMDGIFSPYKIIDKNGIKIGIFGIGIELDGLVLKNLYKETVYLDPIEVAQDITDELKRKRCDLIICLSHLGFQYRNKNKISDTILAEKTKDIDVILGGHTHTFLPAPVEKLNANGCPVLINQVGWAGLYLGRIDFYINKQTNNKMYAYNTIPVESKILI